MTDVEMKRKETDVILENPIDQEEYNHFEKTKQWLQNGIDSASRISAKASDLRKEYNGNDKNDIPPIIEANGTQEVSQEDAILYRKLLKEPYFAHLEYREVFPNEIDDESIYIGEETVYDGSDILIYSWKSEIANELLYNKQSEPYEKVLKSSPNRPFENAEKYIVYPDLRRRILSENGRYLKHINEYVSEYYVKKYNYAMWLSAGEQIADEFLLDILEQKKDEKQITNIIRTIQQNQNTVIRLPLDENFIVEGCAGSGKTMIMLHRLSYLSERDAHFSEINVQVLTPSDDFNEQISALSRDLKLDKVTISSVEQYYNKLLKKIEWVDTGKFQVYGDTGLPVTFIKYMYSIDMLNFMKTVHARLINKTIQNDKFIHPGDLKLYVKQLGIDDNVKFMDYDKLDDLIAILDAIKMTQASILTKEENYKKDYDKFERRIYEFENKKFTLENEIDKAKKGVSKYLYELQRKIDRQYKKTKNKKSKTKLEDEYRSLQEIIASSQKEMNLDDELYIEQIKECAKKLNKDMPDKDLESKLKSYNEAIIAYKSNERSIEYNRNYVLDLKDNVASMEKIKLSEESEKKIELYLQELKRNKTALGDYKQTFDNYINPHIKEVCESNEIKFNQNQKYYLYLKLWWYCLNAGRQYGEYLLCIDEAQNISVMEYELLYTLHGERTIFNIYGDLLQNTNQELGLTQWSEIQNELFTTKNMKLYTFSENYRNTNQITEFVNEELCLAIPMKSIGYDGLPVQYRKMTLELLFHIIGSSATKTAIIIAKFTKEIMNLANQFSYSIGKVDNNGVSILTIDEVKGLEFHTVYIIDKDLSYNEKYIAYTRALSRLYIVMLD